MRREVLHPTALVGGESAAPFAAGPAAADLLASKADRLPQVPRHDPERLVLVPDPLRFGLGELTAPAGPGIAPGLLLVPHPAADIFLVIQESTDGGRGPAFAGSHSARDSLGVEHAHDPDDGQPAGVRLEDAQDDRRFSGQDFKLEAFGSRPALLVQPRGADRHGRVPIGMLTDREAALLLADLPAQRLLLEILELQLIEDAANLDAEGCVLIVTVQAIGDRDDVDVCEMELGQHGEHEVVIACQAREVVDQYDLEGALLAGREEGG